jgi:hypothetical protein
MKEIHLSQGYITQVPNEWYDRLMTGKKWSPVKRKMKRDGRIAVVYARRDIWVEDPAWASGRKKVTEYMHRLIMGVTDPKIDVDHRDGNGLNNTYDNLRVATHAQNIQNCKKQVTSTSRFKGVSWRKDEQLWVARIQVNGKSRFLHYHKTEEDAARAYDLAATEHFGDFAKLNFQGEDNG